jgi:hypothetical protein
MADAGKKRRIRGTQRKEPGRRYYVNLLKWLLGFMKTDVTKLPTLEYRKLYLETLHFLYGSQVEHKQDLSDVATDDEFNRKALMQIQGLCSSSLDQILSESHKAQKDGEVNSNNLGGVLFDYRVKRDRVTLVPRQRTFPYDIAPSMTGKYRYIPLKAGRKADDTYLGRFFLNNPRIHSSKYAFFSRHYDPDIEPTVLLSLIPLLEKFSLNSLAKCGKCDAFFKRTKRKKSNLCRACLTRGTTYKWRADNPEVWKEYQRNRAKGLKGETPSQIRDRQRREKKRRGKA